MLTGRVEGPSREALMRAASDAAARYYGTECVAVRLSDETPNLVRGFTATFKAQEHHQMQSRTYGPAICLKCREESWSNSPLPQADWSEK